MILKHELLRFVANMSPTRLNDVCCKLTVNRDNVAVSLLTGLSNALKIGSKKGVTPFATLSLTLSTTAAVTIKVSSFYRI